MADYIKREDAERMVAGMKSADGLSAVKALVVIPSVDVAPVRHGRWVNRYKSDAPPTLKERWICSWCGNVQTYGETRYCPNCGARMDGDGNEID